MFQLFQTKARLLFTFLTCSFPLLLSCISRSLVYSRSAGEGDMFAHSLSRRALYHSEQICSRKVNPSEGNFGLFVGVCRVRWALEAVLLPPSVWWQILSHCLLVAFHPLEKKGHALPYLLSVSAVTVEERKYADVLLHPQKNKCTESCQSCGLFSFCKMSCFSPLPEFGPQIGGKKNGANL